MNNRLKGWLADNFITVDDKEERILPSELSVWIKNITKIPSRTGPENSTASIDSPFAGYPLQKYLWRGVGSVVY